MSALLWRVLLAVISVVLILALIPPVFRIIGLNLDADLLIVIRICVAGLAVLYIVKGGPPHTI